MYKHGFASAGIKSKTYDIWHSMRNRCNNPNDKDYHRYGGRGIRVCERWSSFPDFLSDMGEKPEGLTLDRIESSGNYEPLNCRWETRSRQARNSAKARMLTAGGMTLCMTDWAEKLGIPRKTIKNRLYHGWSAERALGFPLLEQARER